VNGRLHQLRHRPRPPDEILSCKDLAELQSRLSMMGTSALQDFYRSAHSYAGSDPGTSRARRRSRVTAWKQLRKWR